MIGKFLTAAAAATMVAAPVAAAPTSSAARLSIAPRAASSSDKASNLTGVGIPALVLLAGIAAIGVLAVVNESDDNDFPESN